MQAPAAIRLRPHAKLFYWWPVWLFGFVIGAMTSLGGAIFSNSAEAASIYILRSSVPGMLYVSLIILTVFMTGIRIKGWIPLVIIGVFIAFLVVLAWSGVLDGIPNLWPVLSVRMTAGFYYFTSGILLMLWLVSFFVLDSFSYWRVTGDKLEKMRLFGGKVRSLPLDKITVKQGTDDILRHMIFGFGSGDLVFQIAEGEGKGMSEQITLRNILHARSRRKLIQERIAQHNIDRLKKPESEVAETVETDQASVSSE